eukprot:14714745-Alexandrium_andersonii.AAC.1
MALSSSLLNAMSTSLSGLPGASCLSKGARCSGGSGTFGSPCASSAGSGTACAGCSSRSKCCSISGVGGLRLTQEQTS